MRADALDPFFPADDDLARLDIPLVLGSDCVQCTSLGSKNIRVPDFSHTERFKTIRVTGSDQLLRAHDQKRISALDLFHGLLNGRLHRWCAGTFFCHEIGNDLRINGRLEESALLL